jgi:hypothetical protein
MGLHRDGDWREATAKKVADVGEIETQWIPATPPCSGGSAPVSNKMTGRNKIVTQTRLHLTRRFVAQM